MMEMRQDKTDTRIVGQIIDTYSSLGMMLIDGTYF